MNMTRRRFLTATAVAGVTACTPHALPATLSLRRRRLHRLDDHISFAQFSAWIGWPFLVSPESEPTAVLTLHRAIERQSPVNSIHAATALDADFEKFTLVFRGTPEQPLDQGIHLFHNPRLGSFEAFITPVVTRAAHCRCYEAVYNRPRS